MAEGGKQDCEAQKNEIGRLIKGELKKGEKWYLVDTKWFKQWKKYVGYDSWDTGFVGDPSAHPGPVDNSPILKDDGAGDLKESLIDELDYQLVSDEAWKKLVKIYGVMEPQKPICRIVIEQGMFVKHCKVEVYLMDLKLCPNNKMDNLISKQFSRADKIDEIEKAMRKLFDIKEDKGVRIWNKYMSNTFEPLNNPNNTVQDAGLYEGQVIVIEEQNEDGTWPRQMKPSVSSTSQQSTSKSTDTKSSFSSRSGNSSGNTYSRSSYENYKSRSTSKPGLCGLSNLGNTCFMNSALQCMSNVPALTNYFLAGKWKSELNVNNPLGMHGEIAKSYAELVHDVWSGRHSYTIPRSFKIAVGRFAEQFSGYQQQDSQELMAFLLDGLHEDLNRIKKKKVPTATPR